MPNAFPAWRVMYKTKNYCAICSAQMFDERLAREVALLGMKISMLSPLELKNTQLCMRALMRYTSHVLAYFKDLKATSLPHAALGLVVFTVFAFPQHSSGQGMSAQVIEETPAASQVPLEVSPALTRSEGPLGGLPLTGQKFSEEEIQKLFTLSPLVDGSMARAVLNPQKPPRPAQQMWVVMTAYSSTPDQTDSTPFITASGTHVRDGIVAANFVRIGTKVRIPDLYGNKVFVVEDRMHARFRYRMDIWMPTRAQAKHFGLRNVKIEILHD